MSLYIIWLEIISLNKKTAFAVKESTSWKTLWLVHTLFFILLLLFPKSYCTCGYCFCICLCRQSIFFTQRQTSRQRNCVPLGGVETHPGWCKDRRSIVYIFACFWRLLWVVPFDSVIFYYFFDKSFRVIIILSVIMAHVSLLRSGNRKNNITKTGTKRMARNAWRERWPVQVLNNWPEKETDLGQ